MTAMNAETLPSPDGSSTTDSASPIIQFSNVSKSFGAQAILQQISLNVERGEKVALAGHSGCGKTTLLRCINGLEQIDSGHLQVNGYHVNDPKLDWNRFRARIGMVFQQYNLFPHLSILENIALGPIKVLRQSRAEVETRALHLLEQVGLADKAKQYPDQLSGGQKQRVAIARSLAMEPDILLMDEPTSALDPPMAKEVLAIIEKIAQPETTGRAMTLLIVTHELRFVSRMADRLIFMDGGQIVEAGSPSDILQNPQAESTRKYLQIFDT